MVAEPVHRPTAGGEVASEVTAALCSLADRLQGEAPPDSAFESLFGELRDFVAAGGKRIRPQFLWWGYRAAGGDSFDTVLPAAAALELVHVCALVHDDVMDASVLRRGRPTSHVAFEAAHSASGWDGDSAHYGTSAAIMLGDLALVAADELFLSTQVATSALHEAFGEYTRMRVEVVEGQFLDLVDGNRGRGDSATALHIAGLKTAKYTVERPLRIGARLGGANEDLLEALSAYGLAIGTAFQLRDDLLGAFGDEAVTGKPTGIDFREGKHTYLVTRARELATAEQLDVLDAALGDRGLDDEGVERIRDVLTVSGAVGECEERIAELFAQGQKTIAETQSMPAEVAAALNALAEKASYRTA